MIRRDAARLILLMAKMRRILTIAGPRNSGKSSLARMLFPRHTYLDLESPRLREFAKARPMDFFKRVSGDLILDEYGCVPELYPYIREAARRRQIVLIASRLPLRNFSLSRASRMNAGVVVLLPLALRELRSVWMANERDELIHRGFMPCAHSCRLAPKSMFLDHYLLHVEGYIFQSAALDGGARAAFRSFMKLLAGRVGQIINLDSLSKAVGVPRAALSVWIAELEAAFVIFRLPCYPDNFDKREIRRPKLYFTDVGFAAYLLGIKNPLQVFRDPCVGSLFENMVVADAFKTRCNLGLCANLFYYRCQEGLEIDLIFQSGERAVPMEIKSGREYDVSFADNIKRFRTFSDKIGEGCVIYSGEDAARVRDVKFVNFRNAWTLLSPGTLKD